MSELPHTIGMEMRLVGDIVVALLLGAVVGYEREVADKPAGLRTHMLTCAAAALFLHVGFILVDELGDTANAVRLDPIRVVQAVVTGVSFLGAGTIIRNSGGSTVEGLTTGASLLFVASLGLAVALHYYVLAVSGVVLALVVLRAGKWFEEVHEP